ncbi:MAG: YIP1 family protein [Desulfofustis sp.]|nr:YIP1 family protein [Desulfofustis sp.]
MRYLELVPALAAGKEEVFRLALDGKARPIMLINIAILGVFFGLSNLVGIIGQAGTAGMEGRFLLLLSLLLILYGIFTMFAVLFGLTLIYWAAAKAFGGPGGLVMTLELIGLAALPFWVLAPLLNYAIRFTPDNTAVPLIVLVPLALAFIWSFLLVKKSMVVGQGLSEGKATLAVACMWIFSISAVYVFLP